MARIVVSSWMVRYPLGGNLSWSLQWLRGLAGLGHDVFLIEKSNYSRANFDPVRNVMTDDPSYGTEVVGRLLAEHGLERRFCYVDEAARYHGMGRGEVEEILRSADALIDIGNHGAWNEEAQSCVRVLVDGEPGFTQMKMVKKQREGAPLVGYHFYYSNGANVGTEHAMCPTAGLQWRPIYNPVCTDLYEYQSPSPNGRFTTVMHWKAHGPFEFDGRQYWQKDVEFEKFLALPARTRAALEVAVGGSYPTERLTAAGWSVRSAREVASSYASYGDYIRASLGEVSVAKHGYVATRSGWFSDRSAAYLASGRPVVLQETGFSRHLPCGLGLFAVRDVEEAAAALEEIQREPRRHAEAARAIALEYLAAERVLSKLLLEIGL